MKLRHKILGGLVAFGAAGAVTAAPVFAETPGLDYLVFTGTTTGITCSGGVGCAGNNVPSALGGGTYTFSTGGLVSLCESGGTDPSEAVPSGCSIGSNGTYTNVVCGTGLASGSANVSGHPDGGTIGSYTIAFAGGVGVIAVTSMSDGLAGAGVVDITPALQNADHGFAAPPNCITAFNVVGAVVSVETS
jgi:hypothetical protein